MAHDIGQGLAHEREDGVGDAGVLRARPGLGQGDGEPGAPGGVQDGGQVVPAVGAAGLRGRVPVGVVNGVDGGGACGIVRIVRPGVGLEGVDGAAGVGQAVAGEGVDGGDGLVEFGVVGGAGQALRQGDDGGQGVPHGVVELAGHARLAAGGVALRHEPVLGGLGGEQGVAVLQGLPAGPGDRRRGDDDGEQEDLRRDPADEGPHGADHDQGEGPAAEDREQADNALGRPRNGEQGVEGHQRGDREGRVLRPPQAHARADQAGEDDDRERPAAPAEQGRGDEQGEPQQRSDVGPGVDDQDPARDEQLEQAHDDRHGPQRRGGRAPPGGEPVQGGARHPRGRGLRAARGRRRRARGFARGRGLRPRESRAAWGRRAHETRLAARRSAIVHARAQAAAMAEASAMDPMESMLPGSRGAQAAVMSDSG